MPQEPISPAVSAAQVVGGGVAGASVIGTIWAGLSVAADAIYGVPLQVLFAAAIGAFGAMTYLGQMGIGKLIAASFFYMSIGAFTVPLAMHLLGAPAPAAAGVALVIAGALPFTMPMVRRRFPELIGGLFDKLTGGGPK